MSIDERIATIARLHEQGARRVELGSDGSVVAEFDDVDPPELGAFLRQPDRQQE